MKKIHNLKLFGLVSTPAENCAFMADENCTPEPWVANPMTPSPPCISYEI